MSLAQAGKGGGYLGAAVLGALQTILGMGGAVIALIAWLLIALALTLDVTVIEMVRWISSGLQPVSRLDHRDQGGIPQPSQQGSNAVYSEQELHSRHFKGQCQPARFDFTPSQSDKQHHPLSARPHTRPERTASVGSSAGQTNPG